MSILDIILLLVIAAFVFYGLFFGLIRAIGSLAGILVGTWAAGQTYLIVSGWCHNLFFGFDNWGKIIVFMLIFTVANRLTCLLFSLLNKFFDILTIIPFLKTINRLMGAVFGFIEGSLVVGLILYVVSRYVGTQQPISQWLTGSHLAPFLLGFAQILTPLLPVLLKELKPII